MTGGLFQTRRRTVQNLSEMSDWQFLRFTMENADEDARHPAVERKALDGLTSRIISKKSCNKILDSCMTAETLFFTVIR